MRKIVVSLFLVVYSFSFAQDYEWMTSLSFAKKLALAQDKMLFVMWEGAALDFQTLIRVEGLSRREYVSILDNEVISEILWENFVPVVISETFYEDLLSEIEGKRSTRYIDKFNDDSVKIMDANGNILNSRAYFNEEFGFNWEKILKTYAINTKFLREELKSYAKKQNFVTAYRLAKKYLDLAIVRNKDIERELIDLASIYINEAKGFAKSEAQNQQAILLQKCNLLSQFEWALRDKPKKLLRVLKDFGEEGVASANKSLFNLLNFTAYALLKNTDGMEAWRSKVSLVDLKKVTLIMNKN
ncbi:hypothetical protein RM697_06485 [Ichthyenterobacterium sp. W332]|uniref:Uncharacterized protein n=1 Tax=Microcosmobacter mediterraneus TaxID=3075607 RepID=A0ABU2YMI9_9FLAO|nr:hypothetical protein [Ichthyenterobacterium sp. W332]MDT0558283.1 hypothetical protein [Ichthyenterobacterium sp. W332]